jgi:hypothetical protein
MKDVPVIRLAPTTDGVLGTVVGIQSVETRVCHHWQGDWGDPMIAVRHIDGPKTMALYGLTTAEPPKAHHRFCHMLEWSDSPKLPTSILFLQVLQQLAQAALEQRLERIGDTFGYRVTLLPGYSYRMQDIIIIADPDLGEKYKLMFEVYFQGITDSMVSMVRHELGVASSHLKEQTRKTLINPMSAGDEAQG